MIGLGWVVGEIMIVLMVMGNMSIMDMNIFEGLCILFVNIVVEMFEVEVVSMYFCILFLFVLVLFVFMFLVNIIVEIVCQ